MPTNVTHRVRKVATRMEHAALSFEAAALSLDCPAARDTATLASQQLTRFAREVMGDIGEPRREVEVEPIEVPEPQKVPEKVPA